MIENTFSIIKPDAVKRNLIGNIVSEIEKNGLKIIAQKMITMTYEQAQHFYIDLKDKPFYESLCKYMSSSPCVIQVLSGENAILLNRDIMGATNPAEAKDGTIRKMYAISIDENSIHGSDSSVSAEKEISFFFDKSEIYAR